MTIPSAPDDHPIRHLDPSTLAYVLESVQGVLAAEPDALLETAVGLVTEMQKYSPALAAPVAGEGLDVERLTEVLHHIHMPFPWRWWENETDTRGTSVEFAKAIAREYAALAANQPVAEERT